MPELIRSCRNAKKESHTPSINKRKSHSLMTVAKWIETLSKGAIIIWWSLFTSHLKPIFKLTGVIVGLSPMKWTGRNLCHQLNSWWVFNRLKGQGKVKLIYAVVMNKLDIDGGMISYWDYETWDVVQSVEVHAVLCVLLQVELYPKTIKPLGLIYWYN